MYERLERLGSVCILNVYEIWLDSTSLYCTSLCLWPSFLIQVEYQTGSGWVAATVTQKVTMVGDPDGEAFSMSCLPTCCYVFFLFMCGICVLQNTC
jgi:hypothetical protein